MGACCRKPRPVYSPADPTPCKEIEQGGAGLTVWIMNIRGTYRAVIRRASGDFVTAESFLDAYGCRGPTASALRSNLARVSSAANSNPAAFQRYAAAGSSLVQLLKTADEVIRTGRQQNGNTVRPNPRR
jgi:hypothetical protein